MKQLTIESVKERIAQIEANKDGMKEWGFDVSPSANFELACLGRLVASLEAEAVGEVILGDYDDSGCHPDAKVVCIAADGQADWGNFKDGTRLYTAPPAPVLPEDIPDSVYEILCQACGGKAWMYEEALWNACRAAILHGSEPSPDTNNTAKQFEALATGMCFKQLTVVNMPERLDIDGNFMVPVDDGDYLDRDEVIEAIRAAGLDCREIDGKPSLTTDDAINALATSAGSGKHGA